ncbi:hypothetical protein ABKN59_009401 [Abortiporus biennis]
MIKFKYKSEAAGEAACKVQQQLERLRHSTRCWWIETLTLVRVVRYILIDYTFFRCLLIINSTLLTFATCISRTLVSRKTIIIELVRYSISDKIDVS